MTNKDNKLRTVSWNVRGLGNATKITKVMGHLHQLKGDIFFCRRHTFIIGRCCALKRRKINHVFHSKFNARARGTAIFVRNNVLFEQHKILVDTEGCFVIVTGKLQDSLVILASVVVQIGMMTLLCQDSFHLFLILKIII